MKNFKYNRVLLICIAIGFIAAAIISWQRYQIESETMTVDLVADYKDLVRLADLESLELDDVLNRTKRAGITSLAVYDKTLLDLYNAGKITVFNGGIFLTDYYTGRMSDPDLRWLVENAIIQADRVYVFPHDLAVYNEVKKEISRRLGAERIREIQYRDGEILEVRANYDSFMRMPLGFSRDELEKVNAAGFYVLARPKNYNPVSVDYIGSIFDKLDGIQVSEVVIEGDQMLGAADYLQTTIDELRERKLNLGLIEAPVQLKFYNQAGMEKVAEGIGYDHVIRLYAIPKDEQPKLKMNVAINRWATSDLERNIRINLLRPFEKTDPGKTLIDTNMLYFRSVHDLLQSKGFRFGPAKPFENYYPMLPLRILVMIGTAASIILFLSLISWRINEKESWQMLGLFFLSAAMIVPLLMGGGSVIRLFAAFSAATIFPSLAMILQMDRIRRMSSEERKKSITFVQLIQVSAVALVVTGLVSLMGAVYLSGALSDVEYFLEFQVYRGVKLTFILPIIFVAIGFLQRFDLFSHASRIPPNAWNQFKNILEVPVKIKTLLIFGLVAIAGVVLIARSDKFSSDVGKSFLCTT